jgi:hypothetical protein
MKPRREPPPGADYYMWVYKENPTQLAGFMESVYWKGAAGSGGDLS